MNAFEKFLAKKKMKKWRKLDDFVRPPRLPVWRRCSMRFLDSLKEERRGLVRWKLDVRTVFRSSAFFIWSCKVIFQLEEKFLRINWIITNVYMSNQWTIINGGSQKKFYSLKSQRRTNFVNYGNPFYKSTSNESNYMTCFENTFINVMIRGSKNIYNAFLL